MKKGDKFGIKNVDMLPNGVYTVERIAESDDEEDLLTEEEARGGATVSLYVTRGNTVWIASHFITQDELCDGVIGPEDQVQSAIFRMARGMGG